MTLNSQPHFIEFVYTPTFERTAEGILAECDLEMLERELGRNPRAGKVERGLGGIRKIRIRRRGIGKSKGARVLYFFNEVRAQMYLLPVYSKSAQPALRLLSSKEDMRLTEHANTGTAELLIASLREAVEIQRGTRKPATRRRVRVTAREVSVDPPRGYGARKVRSIRKRLGMSQAVFANTLNVSPATVRGWERGARVPEGPSRRLLEIADRHPHVLLENLH